MSIYHSLSALACSLRKHINKRWRIKMNILIVNTLYYPYKIGGAEKSVQLLAESLAKRGNQVTVATLTESNKTTENYLNGVRVIGFPLKNIYWFLDKNTSKLKKMLWHFLDIYNFRMKKDIRDYFINERFDVVHTNNLSGFSTAVWDWCKKNNTPIVHTARDYYLLHPNTTLFSNNSNILPECFEGRVFSFIKKVKSNHVSTFVSISSYVNEIHVKHGYFKNALKKTIYNSIECITSSHTEKSTHDERIVFGFLGRVEESKGIELLLKEYAKLDTNKYLLRIAGVGEKEYITSLVRTYKNVSIQFEGKVDIKNFLPGIDYLIVPSLWNEPMGRVVIESYSYGKPVIGSSRGGIKEIISNNKTGFLFDPDKEGELYNVLFNVSARQSLTYKELSDNALDYSKSFSTDAMVDEYVKYYEKSILN
ncbi:glycosyltransferase family 4 protein [Klebsiella variicola]|uniref:glycosyltransferase family 4 protein n=1 Tax=Klebsiella variicola TaxID=244366 RepID=UPI002B0530E5|nr:glycosyltransferase family 4 protein [Klebsiella variicola]